MFELDGCTALVTGAGSANGIGFAAGRSLAQMGATVFLTGFSSRVLERAEQLRSEGLKAHAATADLTNPVEVAELVSNVVATLGSLDIVVNNAGMTSVANPAGTSGESGSVDQVSLAGWQLSLQRNLTSAYLVSHHAIEHIRKSDSGRIVMVSSITGSVMAMRGEVAYAAAKSGMLGMTRAMALDEAAHGVTINSVSPGWVATDSQTEHEVGQGRATALGRSGTAQEVAAAIAWLCSKEASYITGQNLVIDGGNSIAEERS
jgi:3-oxoacyl-[acyl-carrier protein] reductase